MIVVRVTVVRVIVVRVVVVRVTVVRSTYLFIELVTSSFLRKNCDDRSTMVAG